jgi:hypothetical protein
MSAWIPPLPVRLMAARQSPLVGRRLELEILEDAWEQVTARRRQLVFVGGEPGAGKTRLLAEVAGVLHDHGVCVLVGTSSPDAGLPYEPFAEMLDRLFRAVPEGSLTGPVGDHGDQLLRLAPSVRKHRPGPGSGEEPVDVGEIRRDLFDAVASLLTAMAAEVPLAVLIDDLQWAQIPLSPCWSTWWRRPQMRRCWWWRPSGPPPPTARMTWRPGWPSCTGWRAFGAWI